MINNDADILKLCLKVNQLRSINLLLCDKKIILAEGELCTVEMLPELSRKIVYLENVFNGDIAIFEDSNIKEERRAVHLRIWKNDNSIGSKMHLIDTLMNRLKSFHEKRNKINFLSSAMISYNMSLSQIRLTLNKVCCEFITEFVVDTK